MSLPGSQDFSCCATLLPVKLWQKFADGKLILKSCLNFTGKSVAQVSIQSCYFYTICTTQWMIKYISLYRSCVHALGIQNLSMEKAIMRILFASLSEQRKKVANFCCDDDWLFRMWQLVARSLATIKKDESLTGLGADAWHSPSCAKFHFLCRWPKSSDPY